MNQTISFDFVNCYDERVFNEVINGSSLQYTDPKPIKNLVKTKVSELYLSMKRLPNNVYALGQHITYGSFILKVNLTMN